MDRALDHLAIALAGVGIGSVNPLIEQAERQVLGGLRVVPAGFNILQQLRDVDMEEIDELNGSISRFRHAITEFYADTSCRGYLNCGTGMDNYVAVRDRIAELRHAYGNLQTASHRSIMDWITLPGANMPIAEVVRAYDKPKGEPTFSKMVLNFAVLLSLSRLEWAEGYLTHLQEVAE